MTATAIDTFKSLGLATAENQPVAKKQSLGQEQFLKLLTTQLTHQDPLKPMENGEFLGQMAQFSTVSGIQDLQASFKDFASSISSDQALQAAGLVGRYVSAPSDLGLLDARVGSISGEFELPSSSTAVGVNILDPSTSEIIRHIDLGGQPEGKVDFVWDGMDEQGQFASPGTYKIQAEAMIDGQNTVLQSNIKSKVESVTMSNGSSGLQVNLLGIGPVNFNKIQQIL